MRSLVLMTLVGFFSVAAGATGHLVEYKIGSQTFEGYEALPKTLKSGKAPAVLIVHDWLGLTEKTKKAAEKIADLGYVAFAVDVYGKGIRPEGPDAAGKEAGKYYADKKLFRERLTAGFEQMKKIKEANLDKMAAIGYCFGGAAVVELARTGVDLKGVVSFHGGLNSSGPEEGKLIKGKVLAMAGADDPYVPAANLAKFEDEMRANHIDWELIKYGNAVHSFTDITAGTDNSKGAAYNEKADKRSWIEMNRLFSEIF